MATNNSEFLKFAAEYLYKTLPHLTVYSEDAQTVIQEQILQCIEAYRGLSMSLQNHPLDGGNESKGGKFLMFVLEGTIPITYQSGHYNIPVNVRLAGGYPRNPPVGYVKSSGELQLKQDHAHVDSFGFCHIEGFVAGQWDGSRTLKDFVDEMVGLFSADPPLYSKPAPLAPSAPTSDMQARKTHAANPADSAIVTSKDEGVPIRRKTKSGAKKRPHSQQQVHHQQQQPVPNPPFPSQTKGAAKSVVVSEQPPSAPPGGEGTREGGEKVLGPERPLSETRSDVSALSSQLSSLSTDDHKRDDAVQNVVADLQDGKIATERAAKVNEKIRQQRKEKEEDVSRWHERPDQNRQRIAQYPAAQGTSSSMPVLHTPSQDTAMSPQQQQSMPPNVMAQQQASTHPHSGLATQQAQQQQPQQQQPPMSTYVQAQPNVPLSMQVPSSQPLPSQQVSPHLQQRQQQASPAQSQPPPFMLPQTQQQVQQQQQQQQPTIPQRSQAQVMAQQGQQLQQPQSMPSHSQGLRVSPQPFPAMQFGNQPQPGQARQYGHQPPRGVYLVGPHAQQPQGAAGYMQDPRHSQQYGQEPPRSQPHVQDQPSTWVPYSQEQLQTLPAAQSRAVFQQRLAYGQDLPQAQQPGSQQRSPYMPEPPPHPLHLPDQQQQQQPQQPIPQSPTSAAAVSMPSQMQLPTGPRQRAAPPPQQQRVLQQTVPSLGQTFSGLSDQSPSPPISQPLPQYGPFLPHQYAQAPPQQAQPQLQPAASQPVQQGRLQPQQVQQRVSAGIPGRWSPAAVGVYSSQSMPIPPVPPPSSAPMFTHTIYPGQTPASPTASPVISSSSSASAGGAGMPPLVNEHMPPQVTSPQATPSVMSTVTFQQAVPVAASSAASPYGLPLSQGSQPSGPPMYMHVPPSYSVSPSIMYSPSGPNLYPTFVQSPRGSLAPYMPHMPGAQPGPYGAYNHNHTNIPQPYTPYNQPQPVGPLPQPTPPSPSMQPGHYAQYGSPYQPVWQQASPPYQGEGPRWG